jgi:elongation factor 1 alpha-like protein
MTGAVLCHPDFPVPLVSRVEARIVVLDVPTPVLAGQQVTLSPHPRK